MKTCNGKLCNNLHRFHRATLARKSCFVFFVAKQKRTKSGTFSPKKKEMKSENRKIHKQIVDHGAPDTASKLHWMFTVNYESSWISPKRCGNHRKFMLPRFGRRINQINSLFALFPGVEIFRVWTAKKLLHCTTACRNVSSWGWAMHHRSGARE